MENSKTGTCTARIKELPPLTLKRQIGGTTYIVSSRFSEQAKEDMVAKVKRLILSDSGQ